MCTYQTKDSSLGLKISHNLFMDVGNGLRCSLRRWTRNTVTAPVTPAVPQADHLPLRSSKKPHGPFLSTQNDREHEPDL